MLASGISLGAAGAAQLWTPKKLSGLFAWFRADKGITLNGSNVSAWADQSGNGRNASQATTAKQPLYVASAQNGRPAIQCTAAGSSLVSTYGTSLAQPCEVWIVDKAGALNGTECQYDGIVGTNRQLLASVNATPNAEIYAGGSLATFAGINVGTFSIYRAQFNGASSLVEVNGVAAALSANPGTQAATGITIGADYAQTHNTQSTIGEVVVVSGVLSATDAAKLLAYLKGFWGIA